MSRVLCTTIVLLAFAAFASAQTQPSKAEEVNAILARTFKAGNDALNARKYDEAIAQYDEGLAADPEQAALLTNKAAALKARGVDRYNLALTSKDEAIRTAGLSAARADFKYAAQTAEKAVAVVNKQPATTDLNNQKRNETSRYAALSVRAEAYRLYVSHGGPSQPDAGVAAFRDYIAVEPDAAKKTRAQLDLAQMLLDAGDGDKATAEYRKILATTADNPEANLGAGLALYTVGSVTSDKAKWQEAANYLQRFLDVAPSSHPFRVDAQAMLDELKKSENIVPQKRPKTK